ncbi:MAG: class II aldolase/adducin family protein [Acidimicrobiales bacterium]
MATDSTGSDLTGSDFTGGGLAGDAAGAGSTCPDERDRAVEAARALFSNGVMSHSGHANISARAGAGSMLLTEQGHIHDLDARQLALVGLDGEVREGKLAPGNAEIVEMHSGIYRLRPAVGGIIHTHSPHLLAFAMANRALPCRYEALLRFGQAVPVPVVPWAPRGSPASVAGITDAVEASHDTMAVLLGNHGVLVFGPGPKEAAALLTVLEEAAEAELAAVALGTATDLPGGALEEVRESMARARRGTAV